MPAPIPPSPSAVERYLRGESLSTIAKDEPCSVRTLYRYMLKELGPEYYSTQQDLLIGKIADADEELSRAENNWQVARATAQGKFARFDLERRHPALYGPRQAIDQQVKVIIRDDVRPVIQVAAPAEDAEECDVRSIPLGNDVP